MQEMGRTGTGSTEQGDSSGEIFWMPYPDPFLTYYYGTFPDELPKPEGAESSERVGDGEEVEVKKESGPHMWRCTRSFRDCACRRGPSSTTILWSLTRW